MAAVGYCSLTAGPRGSLPENRKPTRHALIGLGQSPIGCNSAGWAGVRSSSRVSGQEHQGRLVNADVTRRPPRISAANSRWSLRETRPPQVLILLTISSSNTLGEGEGSRETWANLCFAAYMLATVHA